MILFFCMLFKINSESFYSILNNNFLRFNYKFLVLFANLQIINICKTHTHLPWQENTFKLYLHSNQEKSSSMTLRKSINVGQNKHLPYPNLRNLNHVNKQKSNHNTK